MRQLTRFVVLLVSFCFLALPCEAEEKVRARCSQSGLEITVSGLSQVVQRQIQVASALKSGIDSKNTKSTAHSGIQSGTQNAFSPYQIPTDGHRERAAFVRQYFVNVPAQGILSATIAAVSTRAVLANETSLPAHSEFSVHIERIGVSAGHHIARIELQPLRVQSYLTEALVMDSVLIRVQFVGASLHTHELRNDDDKPGIRVLNDAFCSRVHSLAPTDAAAAAMNSVTRISANQREARIAPLNFVQGKRLRIATTRDGIARINVPQLLAVCPEWRGVSLSSLHLRDGESEMRLYVDGADKYLGDNTSIYFPGKRESGDSTWLGCFTAEHAMYLSVDSSTVAPRFSQGSLLDTSLPISRAMVSIDRHIEEEHDYNQSYFNDDPFNAFFVTDNVEGEKWYWAAFDRRTPFDVRIPVVPSTNPSDSLHVRILYNAINNIREANPDKRVQCVLNEKLVYDETFDSTQQRVVRASLSAQDVFGGDLRVRAVSLGANTDVQNYSEKQILDFIELRGRVQPFAWDGELYGTVFSGASTKTNLRVPNLGSAQVVAFDTVRNVARTLTAQPGVTITAGVRSGSNASATVHRNDSLLYTTSTAQAHVMYFSAPEYSVAKQWSGLAASAELIGFLRSLPGTGAVCLVSNDQSNFSSDVQAWLRSRGCVKVPARPSCYGVLIVNGVAAEGQEYAGDSSVTVAHFIRSANGGRYEVLLPIESGSNDVLVASNDKIETALISDATGPDLLTDSIEARYVIITHKDFISEARRLATFRSKSGVTAKVIDVDDIYRDFSDGRKSPHAIRKFLKFAYTSWQGSRLRNVLLFGDASWDGRRIPPYGLKKDFVPTYGKPVSDVWYSLVDGNDLLPDLNVGRLPVETPEQARAMVDKVIAYDTLPPASWWKHFVFLSGGTGEAEQVDFRDISLAGLVPLVSSDDPVVQPYTICGDTTIITTLSATRNPSYSATADLHNTINGRGAVWLNYIGHGAPTLTEIAGWDTTSSNNIDRPYILSAVACQNAAFAERDVTSINENFLHAYRRGAIAVMGSTGYGVPMVQQLLMIVMFTEMAQGKARTLGDVFTRAEANLGQFSGSSVYRGVFYQCCLLGDPLTRLPFDTIVRPVVLRGSVRVEDQEGSEFVTEDKDSAYVSMKIFNAGVSADTAVPVAIIRRIDNLTDTLWTVIPSLCNENDIRVALSTRSIAGDHRLRIEIDPLNTLGRVFIQDSAVEFTFRVYSPRPLPLEPLAGWDVSASAPVFRFLFSSPQRMGDDVQLELRNKNEIIYKVDFGSSDGVQRTPTHVEWRPDVQLASGSKLEFAARSRNSESGDTSAWLVVPFYVRESVTSTVRLRSRVADDEDLYGIKGLRRDTTDNRGLWVMNNYIPYRVLSAVGRLYYDSLGVLRFTIVPGYEIRINNVIYGDNLYQRGVNVRTINRYTGAVTSVRNFDTFSDLDTCDNCFNGSGRTLNRFLRTAVSDSDYVLMALCGGSYGKAFVARDLDTFKMNLKALGSRSYNLLQEPRSFAFAGAYDTASFAANEIVNTDTSGAYSQSDTVSIDGFLRISPPEASITTPIFGPAKRWRAFSAQGLFPDSAVRVDVRILGYRTPYSTPDTLMKAEGVRLSLDSIRSTEYPYLRAHIHLIRTGLSADAACSGVEFEMDPLPEFAVVPGSFVVTPDSTLRGDTVMMGGSFTRISPRAESDSISVAINIRTAEGTDNGRSLSLLVSQPSLGTEYSLRDTSSTLSYAARTVCSFTIDPDNVFPELYRFNNSARSELRISNDEQAPYISVFIDSLPATDGMWVSRKPLVWAYTTDNSRLIMDNAAGLTARVNLVPIDTAADALYSYRKLEELRTVPWAPAQAQEAITFSPQLEYGTNTIRIRARDYFGNESVRNVSVQVNRDVATDSVVVFPNPFTQTAAVRFDLRSPVLNQTVQLQMYDLRGNIVRSYRMLARLGSNTITVDDRDDMGNLLMQGCYYYRLFTGEDVNLDMRTGVLILVR
jgi:hypothetical protein